MLYYFSKSVQANSFYIDASFAYALFPILLWCQTQLINKHQIDAAVRFDPAPTGFAHNHISQEQSRIHFPTHRFCEWVKPQFILVHGTFFYKRISSIFHIYLKNLFILGMHKCMTVVDSLKTDVVMCTKVRTCQTFFM